MRGLRLGMLTALTCLVITIPVDAQESTAGRFPRVGVGVAIADVRSVLPGLYMYTSTVSPSVFTVPIDISARLRIEPEIGYYGQTYESEDTEIARTGKYLALGLFPMIRREVYNLYFGVRIGITSTTYSYETQLGYTTHRIKESMSGYSITPAIGGEYLISNSFSVGGEAQLNLSSSKGDHEDEGGKHTVSDSVTKTRALLFVRFYLSRKQQ